MTKIAMGCDHGGLELKELLKAHLLERGFEVEDFGTYSKDSCDYPDFGEAAARAVAEGRCQKGIVICTTGIGISIAANKVKGVRCALLSDPLSARLTRQHNDTNMMALGAAMTGPMLALHIADIWLDTEFEGGRHSRRVDKLCAIEEKN